MLSFKWYRAIYGIFKTTLTGAGIPAQKAGHNLHKLCSLSCTPAVHKNRDPTRKD